MVGGQWSVLHTVVCGRWFATNSHPTPLVCPTKKGDLRERGSKGSCAVIGGCLRAGNPALAKLLVDYTAPVRWLNFPGSCVVRCAEAFLAGPFRFLWGPKIKTYE